jgi:hypothetical protein
MASAFLCQYCPPERHCSNWVAGMAASASQSGSPELGWGCSAQSIEYLPGKAGQGTVREGGRLHVRGAELPGHIRTSDT